MKRPTPWTLSGTIALVILFLSGCMSSSQPVNPTEAVERSIRIGSDGTLSLPIEVPIFLVGFEPGTGGALSAALPDRDLRHAHASYLSTAWPERPDGRTSEEGLDYFAMPVTYQVRFRAQELDRELGARFFDAVRSQPNPSSNGSVFDANHAEEVLGQILNKSGLAPRRGSNAIVLLHGGSELPDPHAWRSTMPHGGLEPVRYFGERSALSIFDVSASPDPYVMGERPLGRSAVFAAVAPATPRGYDRPMLDGGDDTVRLLQELVLDLTAQRVVAGALYPVSTRPCQEVVLWAAVHEHSVAQTVPGKRDAREWLREDELLAGWRNLTHDDVSLTTHTLSLPADDPILDELLRATFSQVGVAGPARGYDQLLNHVNASWSRFAGPESGCEKYVGFTYFPDAAQEALRTVGGFATYDVRDHRRLAVALTTDVSRLRMEYAGPAQDTVGYAPGRDPNWPTANIAHEVGHLFGLQHPDAFQPADKSAAEIHRTINAASFQSGWTIMGYQVEDRLADFGTVESNNWARNRATYAVFRAYALGQGDSARLDVGLRAMGEGDWTAAFAALDGTLELGETIHSASPRIR